MTSLTRTATANAYANGVRQIDLRHTALTDLQEKLTSGKRVTRPSDDPTNAGNAERALMRLQRIATEQRALEAQRNAIAQGESTLGDATDALQRFRELTVSAGNGIHTPAERQDIVAELQNLRDEIFTLANKTDANGQPLFGALGSPQTPFSGPGAAPTYAYTFNGLPGTAASSVVSIPYALDGNAAFMLPTRTPNSVFGVLDQTIANLAAAPDNNTAIANVQTALDGIDAGMAALTAVRGQAGALLNRVDRISANQDKRSEQVAADRSRAEDLDMIKGVSDFQNQQTGYQAALQSYAQIQKLSLFNYVN